MKSPLAQQFVPKQVDYLLMWRFYGPLLVRYLPSHSLAVMNKEHHIAFEFKNNKCPNIYPQSPLHYSTQCFSQQAEQAKVDGEGPPSYVATDYIAKIHQDFQPSSAP